MHTSCFICGSEKIQLINFKGKNAFKCSSCKNTSFLHNPLKKKYVELMKGHKKIHFTVAALIWRNKKLLMFDRTFWTFGFTVPSGHVERNDSIQEAVKKEINEETSLEVVSLKKLKELRLEWDYCSVGGTAHYWTVFEALVKGKPKETIESRKIKFYSLKEINKLKLNAAMRIVLINLNLIKARPLVLGITSEFGMGKTTVAGIFEKLGAKKINADELAQKLFTEKKIKEKLRKEFSAGIFEGKEISRKKLAEIVFSNELKRKKLEKIIHPIVFSEMKKKINEFKKRKAKLIVLDVPLLLETNFRQLADQVLIVLSEKEEQLKRLKKKGFTEKEIRERILAQKSIHEKIGFADYVINNSFSLKEAKNNVKNLYNDLIKGVK